MLAFKALSRKTLCCNGEVAQYLETCQPERDLNLGIYFGRKLN